MTHFQYIANYEIDEFIAVMQYVTHKFTSFFYKRMYRMLLHKFHGPTCI